MHFFLFAEENKTSEHVSDRKPRMNDVKSCTYQQPLQRIIAESEPIQNVLDGASRRNTDKVKYDILLIVLNFNCKLYIVSVDRIYVILEGKLNGRKQRETKNNMDERRTQMTHGEIKNIADNRNEWKKQAL